MSFKTSRIPGRDAVAVLEEARSRYPATGRYPFLIGDEDELLRLQETSEFDDLDVPEVVQLALGLDLDTWIAERRADCVEDEFSPEDELFGKWPGEVAEKGTISLHMDRRTGQPMPEVFMGESEIQEPWHLPAALAFGDWNDCPGPEVHCAFHRKWQGEFDSQITGVSGDVIECTVKNPPLDRETALELAWEQYWYCPDIVEQGCETINYLAATLIDSPYWFFWWD